jgi:hypothetical protein
MAQALRDPRGGSQRQQRPELGSIHKVRRAGLCHQAGDELEKIQFFLGTPPGNDSKRRE